MCVYLDSFRENKEGCKDEEEPVYEAGQNFCSDVTETDAGWSDLTNRGKSDHDQQSTEPRSHP